MKKTSTASFIIAIILLVASIALFVLGFLSVNTTQVYSKVGNGYSFMKVSYSLSLNNIVHGLFFVLLGTSLFIGGILMFILAAVTRPHASNCVKNSGKDKNVVWDVAVAQAQPQPQNSQESSSATNFAETAQSNSSCTVSASPKDED